MEATHAFDSFFGWQENRGKRQRWENEERVEHLGLDACPGAARRGADKVALPRGGWAPVEEAIARLRTLPGSSDMRKYAAAACIIPKIRWAAPLTALPPAGMASRMMSAILRHESKWTCRARFWASHIASHPVFAAVIATIQKAGRCAETVTSVARHVANCAALIQLRVVMRNDEGVWIGATADADSRIRGWLQNTAARQQVWPPDGSGPIDALRAHSGAGRHLCRLAARCKVLSRLSIKRHDAPGYDTIDIEASSHPIWSRWVKGLDSKRAAALLTRRYGLVITATRIAHMCPHLDAPLSCPYCDHGIGDARHLFVECRHFDAARARAATVAIDLAAPDNDVDGGMDFDLDPLWWSRQPRCTAKSGWITFASAPLPRERAAAQVAAGIVGIEIVQAGWALRAIRGLS